MKKSTISRLAVFGTTLILSALAVFPAFAAGYSGYLDSVSEKAISGWAWDSSAPDTSVSVELTIAGESFGPAGNKTFTVTADQFRSDLQTALGSGSHGFTCEIDWTSYNTGTYTVTAAIVSGETKTPLTGTHTYKKEDTPATVIPAEDSKQTASGPSGKADAVITGPASDPTRSSDKTSEHGPSGPGSSSGSSAKKTTAKKPSAPTYGPGAPAYETGEADEFLGTFKATAYCGCDYCSGGHSLTYSGTVPQANHTIAADLDLYPIGTKLMVDDIVYTVEDKGSSVVDNKIDIYFETHEEALAFGMKYVDVYSVK